MAALLLACSAVVALAAPSLAACTPGGRTLEQKVAAADDVFTGVIVERDVSGNTATSAGAFGALSRHISFVSSLALVNRRRAVGRA